MDSSTSFKANEAYARLVARRKACRVCRPDLVNQAEVGGGQYDSDHIGAWSRWQGSLIAQIMVVGQDWGDVKAFQDQAGRPNPNSPTNASLVKLLGHAGFPINRPNQRSADERVFFTNAILCLKSGGLQAPVKQKWFKNCLGFLKSQIEIVSPKVVVGLGTKAYQAVLAAYGLKYAKFPAEVEMPEGRILPGGRVAFAVYHCGSRGVKINRPMELQIKDWQRIGHYLNQPQG